MSRVVSQGYLHPLAIATLLGTALPLALLPSANAFELPFGADSELSGSLSMSVGYAASVRTEDADRSDLVPGFASLGLNFASEARVPDKGDLVANVFNALAELDINYRNYGLVGSLSYQYDLEIMSGDSIDPLTGEKVSWTDAAREYAGSAVDLLDAYAFGTFDIGNNALEVRAGKQVINWGEGLFFLDGVSEQVPLNINKLTTPGTELKEAFIGVEALYAQLGIGTTSSLGAYYQFNWRRTEFPPVGTFFGLDAFFRGGTEIIPSSTAVLGAPLAARDPDIEADDNGQWGASFRKIFGDDIEVGVYYSRYHEKFPFLVFNAPDFSSVFDVNQFWPEDLDMFGASISTTLGEWSFNAEVAYRPDRPLFTPLGVTDAQGRGVEEHDTWHASAHGIWLGKAIESLGIDSQIALVQLGVDVIDGNTDNLAPMGVITRDAPGVPTTRTPDSSAWGVAAEWAATWFSGLGPGNDLTLDIFLQYDFSGNSHFWGNFAEDRWLGAISLSSTFGTALEAGLTYQFTEFDESDYEDQDLLIFNVNYKF